MCIRDRASASHDGTARLWELASGKEIARETTRRGVCLEITGHTHAVGPKALNQRLTVRRAEYIKQRLEGLAPDLARRTIAAGKGADENLVGSGSEDARDELDRRIEFAVFQCKATR